MESLESIRASFCFRGKWSPEGRSMLESLLAREQMNMLINAAAAPAPRPYARTCTKAIVTSPDASRPGVMLTDATGPAAALKRSR